MAEQKTCAFFGHADLWDKETYRGKLRAAIQECIALGVTEFICGEQGDFDRMAAFEVRQAKKAHPQIELSLVIPYRTKGLQEFKEIYDKDFDNILYPWDILGTHPKRAITERNRWMVRQASVIIACVYRDFGGAYTALKYARKFGAALIINLAEK